MKLESLDGFGAPCKSATVAPVNMVSASELRRDGLQSVAELMMENNIPFTRMDKGGYLVQGKAGNIEVPEIIAYADRAALMSIINSPTPMVNAPTTTTAPTDKIKTAIAKADAAHPAMAGGGILLGLIAFGFLINSMRSKPKALAGTPPVTQPVKPSGNPVKKSTQRLATVHL